MSGWGIISPTHSIFWADGIVTDFASPILLTAR